MPEEHPAPRAPPSPQRSLATWSDSSSDVASLGGGGQRVRLCNPCVPDPNIAPPQSPLAENQPRPSPSGSHNRSTSLASNSFNQLLGPDSQIGNATWRFLHPDYAQYANPPPPISRQSAQGTGRRSTVSSVASGSSSHQQDNASSVNQNRDGRTSMNDFFVSTLPFQIGLSLQRDAVVISIHFLTIYRPTRAPIPWRRSLGCQGHNDYFPENN